MNNPHPGADGAAGAPRGGDGVLLSPSPPHHGALEPVYQIALGDDALRDMDPRDAANIARTAALHLLLDDTVKGARNIETYARGLYNFITAAGESLALADTLHRRGQKARARETRQNLQVAIAECLAEPFPEGGWPSLDELLPPVPEGG